MKKNYFLAVCCKNAGKQWAFVMTFNGRCNLAGAFDDPCILSANICDSKKEAVRVVDGWNTEFKKAGIYKF